MGSNVICVITRLQNMLSYRTFISAIEILFYKLRQRPTRFSSYLTSGTRTVPTNFDHLCKMPKKKSFRTLKVDSRFYSII